MKQRNEQEQFREQTSFLGYEFLTWAFLFLDRDGPKNEVNALLDGILLKSDVSLILGSRVVTCLLNHKEQKTSISCPILEESHEVFASLKNGHLIESLSLVIAVDELRIHVTLRAQDFALTQIKIKNNFDSETTSNDDELDAEDQVREDLFLRMNALNDAEKIIDALFNKFLQVRVDAALYHMRLSHMRRQIEARLGEYLTQAEKPPLEKSAFVDVV